MTIGEEIVNKLLNIVLGLNYEDTADKEYIANIQKILLKAMEEIIASE